jgi:hypothetical protein
MVSLVGRSILSVGQWVVCVAPYVAISSGVLAIRAKSTAGMGSIQPGRVKLPPATMGTPGVLAGPESPGLSPSAGDGGLDPGSNEVHSEY